MIVLLLGKEKKEKKKKQQSSLFFSFSVIKHTLMNLALFAVFEPSREKKNHIRARVKPGFAIKPAFAEPIIDPFKTNPQPVYIVLDPA